MTEPKLKELQGAARLTKGFFNGLIRRIECTKPLAGSGVSIAEKPDGIEISMSGGDGGGLAQYVLNVCSNGVPATLIVYGPPGQNS